MAAECSESLVHSRHKHQLDMGPSAWKTGSTSADTGTSSRVGDSAIAEWRPKLELGKTPEKCGECLDTRDVIEWETP